jgi:hypothetical protein
MNLYYFILNVLHRDLKSGAKSNLMLCHTLWAREIDLKDCNPILAFMRR